MNKFPEEAEPVRKYIRDNVERPKELPKLNDFGMLRWKKGDDSYCPFTLLHKGFHPITGIIWFVRWWDSQTDPQYAVDQVWGAE